jgi:hypothetical protein
MIGQYLIHFTDGETTLIIEPGEINYDTSLILFGRDTPSWGQYLNDNFIRLLEHFSNDYSPGYLSGVMVGQLWFDTTTNQLRVCKDSEKLLWDPLCNNTSPDLVDLVTYDNIAEYTSSYIKKSGSTLTGPLYVKYPVYALDVANIRYVSKIVCLCADNKTQYSNYVNMVGGSINTKILLGGTTTVGAAAAPKSTVDGKRRNSLSRSTSGIVLIEGDGTLREGAKTMISSSNGSILCVHGSGEFATTKVSCTIKFNNFKLKPTYRVIVNGYNKSTAASGITSPSNDYSDVFVSDITSESFKVTRTISEFDMIFYFMVDGEIDDGSTPTSTVANATKQATLPTGAPR